MQGSKSSDKAIQEMDIIETHCDCEKKAVYNTISSVIYC